jgi:hypothetical protein
MIIQGSFTPNAVGSAPAILFSMPSGYTADSTKMAQPIGTTLAYIGSGMVFVTGTDYRPLSVSLSTSTALAFSDNRTSGLGPINGSDLGSGNTLTFVATIPIVGWTSNVTMADRAVEEYAANSSTTDADDTTSFANGVNGSQFGSFTAQRSKTVRFQTPRQKTDIFILEYSPDAALTWVNTAAGSGNISNYIRQNTATYGMRYIEGANATDMIVQFGAYRINDGSTFGAAGAAWSALASSNTHLWRLRKVSGGASVGFPVSARNIVGDTSGTVVPAGMIGEEIFATAGAPVALTNNAFATIASITLTPGTWDVSGFFVWQNTGTQATVNTGANAGISTAANSATGTIGGVNYAEIFGISPKSGYAGISLAIPPYRLVITSTSQRFLCGRFFADTAGSGNQAVGSIRAVRIA